ncbi:MAG TPA: hypothetical protein VFX15_00300 [Actinomycetes bacterium]|nr:hypothetical protein [Actinomycetes bacterium]
MIARSIRFEDETYYRLVKEARERNVSFQWLVHKMLDEAIDRLDNAEDFKVTS